MSPPSWFAQGCGVLHRAQVNSVHRRYSNDHRHVLPLEHENGFPMKQEINGWVLDSYIAPCACLAQGDLIRFENESDPLKKTGIVVTADCDLEKKKHAKLVTLIPMVPVSVLMENYLLPEDCEKKRSQIESYAFKSFGIDSAQELEAKKALLREKLASTASGLNEQAVIAAKFTIDQLEIVSIVDYKKLMGALGINLKKSNDLNKQISSRGDLLILPSPSELGVEGSIAWVRHIWQVQLGSIAIRTSELKQRPGERIARLDSPYRYRLTQIMAQVFSDIGLPDISQCFEQSIQEAYDHA